MTDPSDISENSEGSAVVEFALVAPVLVLLILGMFDVGHNLYTASVMNGAIQRAARDSSIEGADATTLDANVTQAVRKIAPGASLDFSRKAYTNFSDVGAPEDFTDVNGNNVCDAGEPFEDVNGNRTWDQDRGTKGGGGARDAVLYEVSVTYPRMFPVARLVGLPVNYSMEVATVLRNQPWNLQSTSVTTANCG